MDKPCNLPCPKCGSTDIERLFYAKGTRVPNADYDKNRNRYASGQCFQYYAYKDHIRTIAVVVSTNGKRYP